MAEFTEEKDKLLEDIRKEVSSFQFNHLEAHGKLERELKSQIEFLTQENTKQFELIKDLYRITIEYGNWLRLLDDAVKTLRQEKADKIKTINITAPPNIKPVKDYKISWKFWK